MRFPVPVLDNATLVPPTQAVDAALYTSPHGESQDLVRRARLDRDRDGLLVFFVGVILFRVAAAVYFLADLLVAAAPVVVLAGRARKPTSTPRRAAATEYLLTDLLVAAAPVVMLAGRVT